MIVEDIASQSGAFSRYGMTENTQFSGLVFPQVVQKHN